MLTRRQAALFLTGASLFPQKPEPAEAPVDFICPMDPDVRAKGPGKCPRCGMKLEAGIADYVEYPVRVVPAPKVIIPGAATTLRIEVLHPKTGVRVRDFLEVHEKLFHLFVISEDLQSFAHEHPIPSADGTFSLTYNFPKSGGYRLLADFFPKGGTPQLVTRSLYAKGKFEQTKPIVADMAPQQGVNMQVELVTEPAQPLAGKKTLLFFRLKPHEGLEPFLGAWGHLLAASPDLIDLIHGHPAFAEPGPQIQFNVIFPRPGVHRVWVQFQRQGELNTLAFSVPVTALM